MKKTLTAERVRELLSYDPETGVLTWRAHSSPKKVVTLGAEAGCINPSLGYRAIGIDGRRYYAHRLVFLLMKGRWPRDEVDHINGRRADNCWTNLREVSRLDNNRNTTRRCDNTSGVTGVYWDKRRCKWEAKIALNSYEKHLGYFNDKAAAVSARKAAEREFGFHENHGREVAA